MKPDKSCFNFTKTWLKYFIALCTGTAALLSGPASILAQGLEEVSFTESHIVRDVSANASQYLAMIDTNKNLVSTTDIADILKDNPALLCSVKIASSIDSIGNGAENLNTDNGDSMPGLRGQKNACSAWEVKQH